MHQIIIRWKGNLEIFLFFCKGELGNKKRRISYIRQWSVCLLENAIYPDFSPCSFYYWELK